MVSLCRSWCNHNSGCDFPALDCEFTEMTLKGPINGATFAYFGQLTGYFLVSSPGMFSNFGGVKREGST